jgi:hypothetical protein
MPQPAGRASDREVNTMEDSTSESSALEPGARWVKSSLSFANGDCVEVARLADGRVGVRHS